jgi:ubiquinol-cytochrome c reductase iron-sulfur subunit
MYKNQFTQAEKPVEFPEIYQRNPSVSHPRDLVEPDAYVHRPIAFGQYYYTHYSRVVEPTFPRKADLSKGELAAGAAVTRTDVWHTPNEPAIQSLARFEPNNFRAKGVENMPNPTSINVSSELDFHDTRLNTDHADRRPFVYFSQAVAGIGMASVARAYALKLVSIWWPKKEIWQAGVIEVDIRGINEGEHLSVNWKGKPVFIKKRTPEQISLAKADDAVYKSLRDPETDEMRVVKPEWLIVIGVCTHLGCIPVDNAGDYGAYFCPCHGSHYDHSGRIRFGPAPKNLEVPKYEFLDDYTLKIG